VDLPWASEELQRVCKLGLNACPHGSVSAAAAVDAGPGAQASAPVAEGRFPADFCLSQNIFF